MQVNRVWQSSLTGTRHLTNTQWTSAHARKNNKRRQTSYCICIAVYRFNRGDFGFSTLQFPVNLHWQTKFTITNLIQVPVLKSNMKQAISKREIKTRDSPEWSWDGSSVTFSSIHNSFLIYFSRPYCLCSSVILGFLMTWTAHRHCIYPCMHCTLHYHENEAVI
jgi:hypothetical protein